MPSIVDKDSRELQNLSIMSLYDKVLQEEVLA